MLNPSSYPIFLYWCTSRWKGFPAAGKCSMNFMKPNNDNGTLGIEALFAYQALFSWVVTKLATSSKPISVSASGSASAPGAAPSPGSVSAPSLCSPLLPGQSSLYENTSNNAVLPKGMRTCACAVG